MTELINLIKSLPWPMLIIISGVSLILGDYFAKLWSLQKTNLLFIAAIISYISYGIFFLPSLLKDGLVVAAILVANINVLGFLFIGLVMFGEKLTSLQIIGVVFGIASIIFLSIEH